MYRTKVMPMAPLIKPLPIASTRNVIASTLMLQRCAGCYFLVGNGEGEGGCMTHNPGYDFNDACLPLAASYWVKLAERFLSPQAAPTERTVPA